MASSITTQTPYSGTTIKHHSSVYSYVSPKTKPSIHPTNSNHPANSNQQPNPGNVPSFPQPGTSQAPVFHFGGIPGTVSINKVIPSRKYKLGKLNQRQKQFYKEHGFLVIPTLLPSQLISECQALLTDKNEDDDNTFAVYDNIPKKFVDLPEVVDYVESLVGPNARLVHSMVAHNASNIHHLTPASNIHHLTPASNIHHLTPASNIHHLTPASHHETHPTSNSSHLTHPTDTSVVSWTPLKNSTITLTKESQNGQNCSSISIEMSPGDCLFTDPSLVHQSDKTTFLCSHYSASSELSSDWRILQNILVGGSRAHL